MNSKLLGGILLVVGTTIGAGMLALPVATAQLGFWGSTVLLFACWGVMTACAFLFLEVNLWLPPNSNLVSMAGATLGKGGQAVAWVVYLVLLYSIICAYIAGGGDLFHYILATSGIQIPLSLASLLFTVLFGAVVYMGIRSVDYVNRGLMFGKLGALLLLICLVLPFVSSVNLSSGEFKNIVAPSSLTVTAVSFGCLMIIPSLRTYFGEDVKTLRKAILIGTLIPLICYITWDMVIMGVIPLDGTPGLRAMLHSNSTNSDLVSALTTILQKDNVTVIAKFFTSICMATSFLSVSLSLSDFLSDGFKVKKQGIVGNAIVMGATFGPPIALVLFYPNAFMLGLEFAGISVFILMILLPPLMTWAGRYQKDFARAGYRVPANKALLALLVIFAAIMLLISGKWGIAALLLIIATLTVGYITEKTTQKAV
ncbi:Tyrosine-specific transport protein [Aquicella siphonis]|uniref:Tyrosine-specific transport protein n=1 Tax=Aquicella siphonis TaxID=254247 RepID=A0A5E4PF99_9COXI|nr:aromatic amino acid transport family protein [Aquicella siphonis]VVC75031.1 Tyrosine-specific transport protein [Aquicella siphonis]